MKIAMLSKADSTGGGASKVATELTQMLRNNKIQVDHFTRSHNKNSITIPLYTNFEKKIYHRLLDIGIQEYFPFERKVINRYDTLQNYDIFHFHDITSTISPLTLKYLSGKGRKIVWTIHDCSVVTGGCLYPLECQKYRTTCFNCPQIGSFGLGRNIDLTFIFHKLKKYVLKNSSIHFVAPSKWIADLVYETGYIQNYPTIIPNAVNTSIFKPIDKKDARSILNLDQNRFIILLSSANLQNKYKGLKYSFEVLHKLKEINPFVLIVGKETIDVSKELKSFDTLYTGFIEDEVLLNRYYASADIFLNTSIADNYPLAVLEAMASGTPNFGFATGGIPEIITQGIDGFLVENQNVANLAIAISQFYHSNKLFDMEEKARQTIEKNHSVSLFIEKHIELYKTLLLR